MSRASKKSRVSEQAWLILEETGKMPTARGVLDALGGGSLTDINAELNRWREALRDWIHHQRHRAELPDTVWQAFLAIWEHAEDSAGQMAKQSYAARTREAAERIERAAAQTQLAETALEEALAQQAHLTAQLHDKETQLEASVTLCGQYTREQEELRAQLLLEAHKTAECERRNTQLEQSLSTLRRTHREEIASQRGLAEAE